MTTFQRMAVEDGRLVPTFTKVVNQAELTADCWLIQFRGVKACEDCEFLNTPDCGGKSIRKAIREGRYSADGLPGA